MSKFVFSMQNLLNMKEKLEDQAKNRYGQAIMRYKEAREEYDCLVKRQQMAEEELKYKLSSVLNVREIKQYENAVEIIKTYVKNQKLIVIQNEKAVETAKAELQDAMKERKTFEKLREKAFEAFLKEENAKERKEVDELVSYRYGIDRKRG